jgi:hypothetical protein
MGYFFYARDSAWTPPQSTSMAVNVSVFIMTLLIVDVMRHAVTNHRGLQDRLVLFFISRAHPYIDQCEYEWCWMSPANVISV